MVAQAPLALRWSGGAYGATIDTPQTIDDYVAGVSTQRFDVEEALIQQRGSREVPFPNMDRSGRGVCTRFENYNCQLGHHCPLRHIIGDKVVVCKHWLRGLCKKGDQCEFLHEYDLTRMPECFFFSRYNACSNRECPFRHIDPETKIRDCPWYDRGFCRHGPYCKHRHRRRVICPHFLAGFCPRGPDCSYAHPSFAIPEAPRDDFPSRTGERTYGRTGDRAPVGAGGLIRPGASTHMTCHICGRVGHKAATCPQNPNERHRDRDREHRDYRDRDRGGERQPYAHHLQHQEQQPPAQQQQAEQRGFGGGGGGGGFERRSAADITCFKCGERGHYANRCPRGALAFLART